MKQGIFKITENTALTANVYKMRLAGDVSDITSSGQFVNIKLDGLYLRRPISVCDVDADGVTIIYKVVGKGTEQMSRMTEGELDVLTLGEDHARSLGMNTEVMRVIFLILAALLAGAAVSVAGLLSFVGLLVPHAVRRMAGGFSHLLPLSLLFGAGFVALCDSLSRILFAPYEIPVGILMAFLGAPFFLFILIKGKGGVKHHD